MHAGSTQDVKKATALHGTAQGPRFGARDEAAESGALLDAGAGEQPGEATGAANEAVREGEGDEEEEEEEEAEEELSGSSRCANLGTRDVPKQEKGYRDPGWQHSTLTSSVRDCSCSGRSQHSRLGIPAERRPCSAYVAMQ